MRNITISTKFFDDERIIAISGEFGIAGELCAIKLLCEIRKNGYYLEWTTLKQNFLARTFGVNADVLRAIVNRLAEYGFFSREMLEKEAVLTTEELQRVYFRPKSRRRDISNIPYLIVELVQSEETKTTDATDTTQNVMTKVESPQVDCLPDSLAINCDKSSDYDLLSINGISDPLTNNSSETPTIQTKHNSKERNTRATRFVTLRGRKVKISAKRL